MPRSKEIQKEMREKVIEIYQSGKGYKAISKALGLPRTTVRAIIYKWRKHGTVENLPRSGQPTRITPRAQRQLIQEVTKDPTTTSKELQASLASVKVSVHDSTIRKRRGKNGLHGRVPRQKPLLSKKNIKARLSFARKHLDDPQDFWENTLWTDETKINGLRCKPSDMAVLPLGSSDLLFNIHAGEGRHSKSSLSTYPYLLHPQHLHPLASYPH
ncbi:hypothetical protein QTP70_002743 [Hemibagrus guttatus]|uniref:Transposase n=1 Tax=Hemibagrus guttatus TaxID=175788 RepID=A0AAE0QJI2_9TELE|nr:hypothetical protein QTP70_002743 [Hemibagrus guttatus]